MSSVLRPVLWPALALVVAALAAGLGFATASGGAPDGGLIAASSGRPSAPSGRTRGMATGWWLAGDGASGTASAVTRRAKGGGCWVTSWGASPQLATPASVFANGLDNATVRDLVFTSIGGPKARVRLSNAFGRRPLRVGRAAVGLDGKAAAVVAGSERPLTFGGRESVVIAPGGEAVSDPVATRVGALERITVSVFVPSVTGPATQHRAANQLNYVARGDHVMDTGEAAFKTVGPSSLLADGVDVLSPRCRAFAVVALGDSLTDGFGSTTNADARWTNDLARRLDGRRGAEVAVVDEGIAGNRVLHASPCCGVAGLARLNRDVLAQPGARDVIVLEGINDIGFSQLSGKLDAPHTLVSAGQLIAGYEQLIARARAGRLKVFLGTLLPFRGARYWTRHGERLRELVNRWIRMNGREDGVIDFASAVADPRDPERVNPVYDSGDHLHLNDAGYRAMAAAVDLDALLAGRSRSRRLRRRQALPALTAGPDEKRQ